MPALSDTVECPTCHGVPQMQGDGSGWDGGGSYHAPPCSTCGDRGTVPATPSQSHRTGRVRRWLRRRSCPHVVAYANGQPLYSLRSVKATPANHERWWAWILGEHTCPECGEDFYDLHVGGKPL